MSSIEILNHNPIFKVHNLTNNNTIAKIMVFYGYTNDFHNKMDELNELFKDDSANDAFIDKNTGLHIFSDVELELIKTNKTEVEFVEEFLHIDDSIERIKLKMVQAFLNTFSLDEIYLFCDVKEKYNPVYVYNSLTQNNKMSLTYDILNKFITNIKLRENGEPLDFVISDAKQTYNYEDILALNLKDMFIVDKPIGQKFMIENEYLCTTNPYNVKENDSLIDQDTKKKLTTLNGNLLLNVGQIYQNNIYLCLAENVLNITNTGLSADKTASNKINEYIIKIYFPLLFDKNIINIDELLLQQQQLIENTNKSLTSAEKKVFESIDLFFNIYKQQTTPLDYKSQGIKQIKLIMHQEYKIKFSLDIIFKIIHASNLYPLIKCNYDYKQENIYRLYTDKVSTDGRKIPYLTLAEVNSLSHDIAKKISVAVYIEYKNKNNIKQSIICSFGQNGDITLESTFDSLYSIIEINDLFNIHINPLIDVVKTFFEQSGYNINSFESIDNLNVEIIHIVYNSVIGITKSFNIRDNIGCISSVFNVEKDDFSKNKIIDLRFKRVSNFNKLTSQTAFIVDQFNNEVPLQEMVTALMQNYNISQENAMQLINSFSNEKQVEYGVRKGSAKIKVNPGFKTVIYIDTENDTLNIAVENINDINYLYTLPIYIDSFVQITQDTQIGYFKNEITRLCTGKSNEDIGNNKIHDNIAAVEESPENRETPVIIEKKDKPVEIKYVQPKKPAAKLFGFDSEGEEESEEEIGGAKDESSNSDSNKILSSDNEGNEENEETEETEEIKERKESLKKPVVAQVPVINKTKTLKNKVIDSDADSDGDEENDGDADQEDINTIHDVSKIKLKNPYYFQKRMENQDKVLFSSIKDMKFKKYSRMCPASFKRQPVVLSKEELKKVLKENPNAMNGHFDEKTNEYIVDNDDTGKKKDNDILKYGADPKNSNYYMCPQYWCLPKNMPLTQEQVDDGKVCGGKDKIIPANAKNPGKNTIYQFFNKKEHEDQDGKYIQHYPGFHSEKTGEDYCIPCCFKNNDTPEFINRMRNCKSEDAEGAEEGEGTDETIKVKGKNGKFKNEKEEYIKGPEKFPLASKRWGYLPMVVAKLLHDANEQCQINQSNIGFKNNQKCLLRCGVEKSANQSFIACIASAKYYNSPDGIPSIREMKNEIIKSLTIDDFIRFQNGNLVVNFEHNTTGFNLDDAKNEYDNSELYKNIIEDEGIISEKQKSFFKKVVQSYINFKEYLNNDEIEIDYTYLWDMICEENSKIIKHGANLVILEIPENDVTNNIEVICPTNQYSNEIFNTKKNTIILIKKNDIFEPIYLYSKVGGNVNVTPTFTSRNTQLPKKDKALFKIFANLFNKCQITNKPNEVYEFKQPILLVTLIKRLQSLKYKIINQVLNYQGKVIGVIAKEKGKQGFIPCYPSALYSTIGDRTVSFIYMSNNTEIWNTYEDTIKFLNNLCKKTKPEKNAKMTKGQKSPNPNKDYIPCKPKFRVIDDEHVVGILTESNQFVQISDPFPKKEITKNNKNNNNIEDDIEDYVIDPEESYDDETNVGEKWEYKNGNIKMDIDTYILNNNKVDDKRINYVKKIKLETKFFNIFRNSIRQFLINNIEERSSLDDVIKNNTLLYYNKLKKIKELLEKIAKDKIIFEEYDYETINTVIKDDMTLNNIEFTEDIDFNFENEINKIGSCATLKNDKCSQINSLFCKGSETQDNEKGCALILPKINLLTRVNNEEIYYYKMADELIRYNRIKEFIFEPDMYLSFNTVGYNLNNNEIIILESLIKDYFKDFVPEKINDFAKYNSYDTAHPKKNIKTQSAIDTIDSINNLINEDPIMGEDYEDGDENGDEETKKGKNKDKDKDKEKSTGITCDKRITEEITSTKLRSCFPQNSTEIEFRIKEKQSAYCTFKLIFYILEKMQIRNKNKTKYATLNELKSILVNNYSRYIKNYERHNNEISIMEKQRIITDKILDILIAQGKNLLGTQVQARIMDFDDFIWNNAYFLTNLDIWILLSELKIPAIFITKSDNNCLFETGYSSSVFVAYSSELFERDEFIFIISPGISKDKITRYQIIEQDNRITFGIDELTNGECKTQINEAIELYKTTNSKNRIADFLANYVKPSTSEYHKKCVKPGVNPVANKEPNKSKKPHLLKPLKNKLKVIGDFEDNTPYPEDLESVQPAKKNKSAKIQPTKKNKSAKMPRVK